MQGAFVFYAVRSLKLSPNKATADLGLLLFAFCSFPFLPFSFFANCPLSVVCSLARAKGLRTSCFLPFDFCLFCQLPIAKSPTAYITLQETASGVNNNSELTH